MCLASRSRKGTIKGWGVLIEPRAVVGAAFMRGDAGMSRRWEACVKISDGRHQRCALSAGVMRTAARIGQAHLDGRLATV